MRWSAAVVVGTVCATTAALVALAFAAHYDRDHFVRASAPYAVGPLPGDLKPVTDGGYDGQFMLRLAVAPTSTADVAAGLRFDHGRYRQQRIGYPLLAWIGSGGDPDLAPVTLILVNVAALGLVGFVGAAIALGLGRSRWWGAAFAAYPGFVFTLTRDLSEILAAALVLGGILAMRRHRPWAAGILFLCAVLTRETTAVVPVALAIEWVYRRTKQQQRPPLPAFALPLAGFASFQAILAAAWDQTAGGLENFSVPLTGLAHFVAAAVFLQHDLSSLIELLEAVVLLGVLAAAAAAVLARPRMSYEVIAWAMSSAILLCVGYVVWKHSRGFLRGGTEAYVLGLVLVLEAPSLLRHRVADLISVGYACSLIYVVGLGA